jgi:itaconate CoA-transferase
VLPLQGVLVVGLEQAVSAPHCTRQLADLGARVIKIESVAGGDFARGYDDTVQGVSALFAFANRGKESVALDLKSAPGREALELLLARADVLVQNLAPGAAARMGVDAASACERHPRLVAVDISGYGTGGPRSASRAYDLLVQSEAGSCAVTGRAGEPAKPGIAVADIGTGMVCANAVLAALFARSRTGSGAAITVGMFDVVTDWMSAMLHVARATGVDPVPLGVGSPMVAPYGDYRTSDDQTIVIGTTNDAEWQRLTRDVMRRPDLAEDPRYATNIARCELREEIDVEMRAWAAGSTLAQASAAAEANGIGWARLNTPTDLLTHPQLVQRGRYVDTRAPLGQFQSLRPPADCPQWQWSPGAVPALGEHTAAVLHELGLSEAGS